MARKVKRLRVTFGDGGPALKSDRDVALESEHELIERIPTPYLIAWLPVFAQYAVPGKQDLRVVYGK